MMRVSVQNFRGCQEAKLECSMIALLCGQNEQGKSSTIDAIRAVLLGQMQPYGLTKDQIGAELLYTGADAAVCKISLEDGSRIMRIDWPSGEVQTAGAPLRVTPWAAGAKRLTALNDRERSQVLGEYLRTAPTQEEFTAAITAAGLKMISGEIAELWADIKAKGWDGAWDAHKTEGTKLKGAWENITKEKYGSQKAINWRRKGWTAEHEALKDEEIADELHAAEKALEEGIGKVAINDDERKKLEAVAKNMPKLKEAVSTRAADLKRAEEVCIKAENALKKIPALPKTNWPCCPNCQTKLKVIGADKIEVAPADLSAAERKKITEQLETAQKAFDEAFKVRTDAQAIHTAAAKDLETARNAVERLEQASPEAQSVNLQALRDDVTLWKQIKDAKELHRGALLAHMAIDAKIKVVNIMAPEGLRKAKLVDRLGKFNEQLAALCEIAGWAPVTISAEGIITLAGYRYPLCAESGQARIDVTLQIAMAQMDGSDVILVDGADKLDGKGRNGLFQLLAHTERYAVVGMMLTKAKEAPDLAAAGLGGTYWIQDGRAQALEAVKAKAA